MPRPVVRDLIRSQKMSSTQNPAFLTLVLVLLTGTVQSESNNVCSNTWAYYFFKPINRQCWYDPDVDSTLEEIAVRYGYPVETYTVVTSDGYILTTNRIPHNGTDDGSERQPIFLQHGATVDAACWFLMGNKSLPFYLADRGYDVWLGNTRGTRNSLNHITLEKNSPEYWNFSLDEIGRYDLQAEFELVANVTGLPKKIIYIGHSMGCMLGAIHGMARSEEAEKYVAGYVLLAPAIYVINAQALWIPILTLWPLIKYVLALFGEYGVFQYDSLREVVASGICDGISIDVCYYLQVGICGVENAELKPVDRLPLFNHNWFNGLSTATLLHYSQIYMTTELKMYDYGIVGNLQQYGQETPPFYNLSDITLPTHILHALGDFPSRPESNERVYNELGSTNKSVQVIPANSDTDGVVFTHCDFVYSKKIEETLHEPLLEKIEKIESSYSQ